MATVTQSRGKTTREIERVIGPITLTGMAIAYPDYTARTDLFVKKITMIYVGASSASGSTGVTLLLGTHDNPTKFAVWNSEVTKALWSVVDIPVNTASNQLANGSILVLRVGTGKTNAGKVNVQIDLNETR